MKLQVYVRHPDDTSLLIDVLSDQEEATALCHDLVAVDGYECAEVWSEDGDRLYVVERREGGALHVVDDMERPARPSVSAPGEARRAGDDSAARDGRSNGAAGTSGHGVPRPGVAGPGSVAPGSTPRILGEQPDHPERWLGL